MKYLYRTSDVIKFLLRWDCDHTATYLKERYAGAEFLDSVVIKSHLIDEIYEELAFELNKYGYISK